MLLTSLIAAVAIGQTAPPSSVIPTRFRSAAPLPTIPPVTIDNLSTGGGIAQQTCRSLGLQARILWIDGTANIDKINSDDKIKTLVAVIKDCGFNTIVLDVKPIAGLTLYPSAYAPRLSEWRGQILPPDFDPVAAMCRETKANGITLFASLNAFSEGHTLMHVGPGYLKPDWQSVLYDPIPSAVAANGASYPIQFPFNQMQDQPGALAWFNEPSKTPLPNDNHFAVVLDRDGVVLNSFEKGSNGTSAPTIPERGSILVGNGGAAEFLRQAAVVGQKLHFAMQPNFSKIEDVPNREIPLCVNPNNPDVQDYELNVVREVITKYPVDGILFDDRLRYAGIDGDFSPVTRTLFEKYVGHKIAWPDDVFRFTLNPNQVRGIQPGPLYDTWMAWRAHQLKAFIYRTRLSVKALRPSCLVGLYAGSWYGEYPALGNNWASPDFTAGFWFLTPDYRQTGMAGLLDFLISGCYYTVPTIYDAMGKGAPAGATVEASADLVNRAVRDQTWTYAGLGVSNFNGDANSLRDCIQAACASSQGVMIFDLSHNLDDLWPLFKQAFAQRAQAPDRHPDLLAKVRALRARLDKRHIPESPVIIMSGSVGTGQ
jgi:hypothetical protein